MGKDRRTRGRCAPPGGYLLAVRFPRVLLDLSNAKRATCVTCLGLRVSGFTKLHRRVSGFANGLVAYGSVALQNLQERLGRDYGARGRCAPPAGVASPSCPLHVFVKLNFALQFALRDSRFTPGFRVWGLDWTGAGRG